MSTIQQAQQEPHARSAAGMPHAMTCDVEDYFQVSAFSGCVERGDWEKLECRIPANVERILDMYSAHDVTGTFFVLGWVAERYPGVVRRIVDGGHELASHGMEHVQVWRQDRSAFLNDARTSKQLLEDTAGTAVKGYRAASWSIDNRSPWAHEVLAEAGYEYSSSTYPISHDHYGDTSSPVDAHEKPEAGLLEVPASTVRLFGRNVAAAGGGYFRLYPLFFSRWLVDQVAASQRPCVFYFHPWELDPGQPRVSSAPFKSRFRHYLNLGRFEERLRNLLQSYEWGRMDNIFLRDPSARGRRSGRK